MTEGRRNPPEPTGSQWDGRPLSDEVRWGYGWTELGSDAYYLLLARMCDTIEDLKRRVAELEAPSGEHNA